MRCLTCVLGPVRALREPLHAQRAARHLAGADVELDVGRHPLVPRELVVADDLRAGPEATLAGQRAPQAGHGPLAE